MKKVSRNIRWSNLHSRFEVIDLSVNHHEIDFISVHIRGVTFCHDSTIDPYYGRLAPYKSQTTFDLTSGDVI